MHRLFFSIKRVHWMWQARARKILSTRANGWITPAQLLLLRTLYTYRRGVVRFKLAQLLGIAASGLSRMVKRLEQEGLVDRSKPYRDKRLVRVKLSDGGVYAMKMMLGREDLFADEYEPLERILDREAKEWFASTPLADLELGILDRFLIRARARRNDRAIYPVPWQGGEVNSGQPGVIEEPPPTRFRVAG